MTTDHELEIVRHLAEQSAKIDAIRVSLEQLRRYFLYKFIVTIALVVLPLIGLVFTLPTLIATLSSQLSSSLTPLQEFQRNAR